MERSARNSVIALTFLTLAILGVGAFYLGSTIQADVESTKPSTSSESDAIPLKQGMNKITNGPRSIYLDSEVIANGSLLITIAKAKEKNLIGDVKSADGKTLGVDTDRIEPGQIFEVNAISESLLVVLEKI